ncbi:MAG TPA: hypothetical protein VIN07_12595 [Flavipsychrobacter sp.]
MKTKIVMLALGLAFTLPAANAQQSRYDINYPVCKKGGDYVVCDKEDAMQSAKRLSSGKSIPDKEQGYIEPECKTTVVYLNKSNKGNEDLTVKYEMPNDGHAKLEPECTAVLQYNTRTGQYDKTPKVCDNTVVCLKHQKKETVPVAVVSAKGNTRLVAGFDMPGDVYEGKDVESNDGVAANRQRNINYLDFGPTKVPNDGGLATQD